jgi:hypothetical protein
VAVILRPLAAPPVGESWWQAMQNARQQMADSGCRFMDEEEMRARVESVRENYNTQDVLR